MAAVLPSVLQQTLSASESSVALLHLVQCGLTIPTLVDIPVFASDDLTCETHTYIPMALIAHLGQDQAGHYVLALRTMKINGQTEWMLCDDSFVPRLTAKLPKVFCHGINMVWLIHDQHQLLHMHPTPSWHEILQTQAVTT